ncbi:FKBP-type peptidyl-prolyl cis-trans isomerase [Aliamphritea ceti]|uniref:FKBP-type peptidyl-prolyl cis-trans isomerase n=1 Tax=Aliamphritea ceti TaxID=1524258 RepID=UPI0021C3119B|nr:peptidylprolyl isomerase [Aliamphritea ceti]
MNITENCYVEFHYELFNENKEVVDSSRDVGPLPYVHGQGNIIPGLEQALADHKVGDKLTASIEPDQGYGDRDEERVSIVDKASFDAFPSIEAGMFCQIGDDPEHPQLVTIVEINEEDGEVTIDANHPFAGKTLNFEIEVMVVRQATDAELQEGVIAD